MLDPVSMIVGGGLGAVFGGGGGSSSGGGSVQQVPKLTPAQERLVEQLVGKAGPAIRRVGRATIPGMEFAPGGPSPLQQQSFGLMSQLPGQMEFDPTQIASMMEPVGEFARRGFQEETIPAIMSALGYGGGTGSVARSSGAANILGREGRNLELGLTSQLAPLIGQMQFQGLQQSLGRQMQIPGMMGAAGGMQRGIGEEQTQFGLGRFMAGAPEADPRLGFIGPAFTSAYDTAVQQGYYQPNIGTQLLGAMGPGIGAYFGAQV